MLSLCLLPQWAGAVAVAPEELAEAHAWSAASFQSIKPSPANQPALIVVANHDAVKRNARGSRPLRIGNTEYSRGLYCHAFSKLIVRLPRAGRRFTAIVGVDSNEQTSGGRGSVDFSVSVAGTEKFRSGVMREGMAGKAVDVNLAGAREFILQVEETPDGIASDQADWAQARVTLDDGRELWLGDLPLREEGAGVRYSTEPSFSFVYDGKPSSELLKTWKLERSSRRLDENRTERLLKWSDAKTGLQVRCVAVEYADFPTVEWTLHFKNNSTKDTPILSDIQAVDMQVERTGESEFVLNHNAGDDNVPQSYEPRRSVLGQKSEHRFSSVGGRPTQHDLPYFNLESPGKGLIVVIGWPGQWAAQFTRDEGKGLRVRGGQELTHFKLRPNEEVRSPLIVLQFWQGDSVHAQNVWRRWMLAHNTPRDRQGKPPRPLLASASGGFFPGLKTSEAGERQFISAFKQAGIKLDYWWIDAGWYSTPTDWSMIGTWEPNPERYPQGFKPLSDLLHRDGTGLIVWFEPERVSPETFLYTNHPQWLLGRDGEQKLLDLGNPEARQWLTNHVDAMLTKGGIDFYRQDFNIDPLPFWKANDAPDRQGITEIRHVTGYLAYWDELRRRHPGLRIDSCASGGRRNDLETLRRAVPLLRSDYAPFDGNPVYAIGNQGHTYGLSSWVPYYGQGVYFTTNQYVYSARSSLSPAFILPADVRKPEVDLSLVRHLSEQWRSVADCLLGDYYPLTSYQLNEELWLAWQFDLPESDRGMVQGFRRANSIYESVRLKLRGLDVAARYSVMDIDDPKTQQIISGRELMEKGLLVTASEQPAAPIYTYRKVK